MRIIAYFLALAIFAASSLAALHSYRSPRGQDGQHQHPHPGGDLNNPIGSKDVPPVETPTTLTFFENTDMTGASYTVQVQPHGSVQTERLIATNELTGAGLAGKVSAARLACGTRPSRASLFDINWSQFSNGTMVECMPGQKTDINLASHDLDDKINAAALVAHVRTSDNNTHLVRFSTLFASAWKTQVQQLGGGATAKWTQIWLDDFQDIHVEQALQVDNTWCSARDAVFDIRINVSASNFKPVFKVYGISSWVGHGFGDAWGCYDGMVKSLSDGIRSASTQLEQQLPQLVIGSSSSAVFYFSPEGTTKDYDLFFWK
jgi:hypothetical protein